jgi:hypothetical protein
MARSVSGEPWRSVLVTVERLLSALKSRRRFEHGMMAETLVSECKPCAKIWAPWLHNVQVGDRCPVCQAPTTGRLTRARR